MTTPAKIDTRHSLVPHLLIGASLHCNAAHELETSETDLTQEEKSAHMAYVLSVLVQCATAIEAEIAEVIEYGPGCHSNQEDRPTAPIDLSRLAETLDKQPALVQYQIVLHLLGADEFDKGTLPFQHADLLLKARNRVIHFRSKWRSVEEQSTVMKTLMDLRLKPAPHRDSPSQSFFPFRCMSASFASWCINTTTELLGDFNKRTGAPDWLAAYSSRLDVPKPSRTV